MERGPEAAAGWAQPLLPSLRMPRQRSPTRFRAWTWSQPPGCRSRSYTIRIRSLQPEESVTSRSGQATEAARRIRRREAPDMVAAKVVPVRLPEEALARVEAQRARLGRSTGLTLSTSQVLRMVIERGLA